MNSDVLINLLYLLLYFVIGAIIALITGGAKLFKEHDGWALFLIMCFFWLPIWLPNCLNSLLESIILTIQKVKLKW